MNYTQLTQLLLVAAIVMIPLGALLGILLRRLWTVLVRLRHPRYLRRHGVRRRVAAKPAGVA